jgi:hypothetical protein
VPEQYLAAESDAPRLQPTDIPILTYAIPTEDGQMDPANVSVNGKESFFSAIRSIGDLFVRACSALMSNSTVLAHLEVNWNDFPAAINALACCAVWL